jgi:hypothetical protein
MFAINWTNLAFFQYLVIGGAVLAVLAVGIYFLLPRIKLPVSVVAAVGSLALGFGGGALTMAICGYHPEFPVTAEVKNVPLPRVEQWLWGGGILAVLAVLLSLLPMSRLKLPASAAAALGSLVLGFSGGLLLMTRLSYDWDLVSGQRGPSQTSPSGPSGPRQWSPEDVERARALMGMSQKGNQTASLKAQLIALIENLDRVTENHQLDPKRKEQVLAQLQGLEEKEQMSEDEAKGQRDALLSILKVRDRWIGTPTEEAKAAATAANPFKAGKPQQHLKALQERLSH